MMVEEDKIGCNPSEDYVSINDGEAVCEPVIPAIHLAKLPICFTCGGKGHHRWQC